MLARQYLAFAAASVISTGALAQGIRGTVNGLPRNGSHQYIVLWGTSGTSHAALDSAIIDESGSFRFEPQNYPVGYYRLGFRSDQVDIILGDSEEDLIVLFNGQPLQEGVTISSSSTNQRLWEYKLASREGQRQRQEIEALRAGMDPRDEAGLMALAGREAASKRMVQDVLNRMVNQAPDSYFARVVRTDQAIVQAMANGPEAVRDAMDWSDASLTRSSVFPRAIMALLQSCTPATPETLQAACDSVLAWASRDTVCWDFARKTLVELFSTYGPPDVVQHLVDRYITGPSALVTPDAGLLSLVAEQLKFAIGAVGPDIDLPSPDGGYVDRLSERLKGNRLTALFFYSSTCDHCHAEMPGLNSLYELYRPRGFDVLGIALDDSKDDFLRNIHDMSIKFPCFSEFKAWSAEAAKAYAIKATPTIIVVDADRRIVFKPYDGQELAEFLRDRLAP